MTIVPLQRRAAPAVYTTIYSSRRPNLVLRAALLGLFGAPLLPAHAQVATPVAVNAGTAAQEPSKLPTFPEIVVNSRQEYERRAGTRTVIRSEDLERQNVTEMGGIVRYQPLISAPVAASGGGNVWDGAGNTGYNIRGLEGNRVSLDVDGIALPDAAPKPDGSTLNAFGTGRDYFDPETFREVRIDSGSTAVSGANPGLGGGVSFITRSPEDYLGAGVDTYIGYKYGRTTANRSNAHTLTGAAKIGDSLQGLAVYVRRDGDATDSAGTTPENPDDWHSDALLSKLVWALPGEQKLDLTIDMFERKNQRDVNNKITAASYPDGIFQDSTTRRTRISLGHEVVLKDFALFDRLTSKVYAQNAKIDDHTDARYISQRVLYQRAIDTSFRNDTAGLTTEAFKQLDADNALVYGVQLEQNEARRPWLEDRIVVATGVHQITRKNRMADMDSGKLALYARDDHSFSLGGKQAVLTPGLRVERRTLDPKNLQNYVIAVPAAAKEIRKESDTTLTPSLALSVEVLPQIDAYATFTRGTRLPTAAERTGTYDSFSYTGTGYAVLGNPNLRKETSKAYELGLKGDLVKGLAVHLSAYRTDYRDMVEYVAQDPDPVNYPTIVQGLFRPENIGNARTWGGELALRAQLGAFAPALQGYRFELTTGVAKGRATNSQTGLRDGLASVAPAKTALTFGYDHSNQLFGLALTALHADGKQAPNDVISGVTTARYKVPAYTIFDLSTYWNVHRNAKIIVGVYNLTDHKYWDYAASRTLAAGTTAANLSEIQRYAKPGRNVAASLSVNY